MATTTPNYGWDVPTSTDYVAQGAVAIETLGDDIDASLFSITGGRNVGMVHLNTTSFTSAGSITVDNVFTTAYDNYFMQINSTGVNGGGDPFIQFRAGGVPTIGTGYNWSRVFLGAGSFGTPGGGGAINTSNINIGSQNGSFYSADISLYAPRLAQNTRTTFASVTAPFAAGPYSFTLTGSGTQISSTQFDGFSFTFGLAATGVCRIYGLRNS